jgi:DNA-binding helix-hairpin-helix protein with protein kinase domain
MGDVNPNNVLVSDQALISLIDCDSFQVQSNGRTFRCEVGVAEYTPPELQGVVFKDVNRTENHDRFGLAVLIFHLLFMGRHPFAGRYRGPDDMSLERAIRECRFPFSLRRELQKGMEPPPLAPTLELVTADLAALFDRAFADAGKTARPTAYEWSTALLALENQLVACRRDPSHKYAAHVAACPWCRFEDGTPPVVFYVSPHGGLDFSASLADLAPVLAELDRIAWPQTSSPQPAAPAAVQPAPLPPNTTAILQRVRRVQVACAVSGLVLLTGLVLLVFMSAGAVVAIVGALGCAAAGCGWSILMRRSQLGAERTRRAQALRHAHRDQAQWRTQWKTTSAEYARRHAETRSCIDALRKDYGALAAQFQANLATLEHSKEASQRTDYLRNELIEDAVLKGIGGSVKSALRSEGIESAHDVLTHNLDGIPGIGKKRQEVLIAWAHEVAQRFRFDARKDVPLAERRALVAKYRQRTIHLKAQLDRQVADLRQGARDVAARLEHAQQGLITATAQLGQAQVDWIAIA